MSMHAKRSVTARGLLGAGVLLAALLAATTASSQDGPCGRPVTDGDGPKIRDCIYIARAGLGAEPCANCVCDTNGSGDVRITDALRCLIYVIGGDVTLDCPECIGTTTTTTLPPCATCNEVLIGLRDEDELCEESALLYDEMLGCPCGTCREECLALYCPTMPEEEPSGSAGPGVCFECLRGTCLPAIANCAAN